VRDAGQVGDGFKGTPEHSEALQSQVGVCRGQSLYVHAETNPFRTNGETPKRSHFGGQGLAARREAQWLCQAVYESASAEHGLGARQE